MKNYLFNKKEKILILSSSFLLFLFIAFSFSFSVGADNSLNMTNETNQTNETELRVYQEPEKLVYSIPAIQGNNIFDSKSYYVTITGNELNYDFDYEILENGEIEISFISPSIPANWEVIKNTPAGNIIMERESEFNKRKNDLLEKYDEVNISRKEAFIYKNMPVKNRQGEIISGIAKEQKDDKIIYSYRLNPTKDDYIRLGETSAEIELLTDLVSYYKLDETSGNAVDSHSTKDLTETGTVPNVASGIINSGRGAFSNSNYFSNDNVMDFNGDSDFTFSTWMYKVSDPSGDERIINFGGLDTDNFFGNVQVGSDGKMDYRIVGGGGGYTMTILDKTIPSTEWFHLVITYDGSTSTGEMFIDKVSQGTDTYTSTGETTATKVAIGSTWGVLGASWGYIDEIGIWSRVLTSDEIEALYNDGDGLSYDSFDDEPPQVTTNSATDITGVSAKLNGELTDLGDYENTNVFFRYREKEAQTGGMGTFGS